MGLYAEMMKQRPRNEQRLFDAGVRKKALENLTAIHRRAFDHQWNHDLEVMKQVLDRNITFPIDHDDPNVGELVKIFVSLSEKIISDLRREVEQNRNFKLQPGSGGSEDDFLVDPKAIDARVKEIALSYVFNLISTVKPELRNEDIPSMFYNKLIGMGSVSDENHEVAFDKEYQQRLRIILERANTRDLKSLYGVCGEAYFQHACYELLNTNTKALNDAINVVDNIKKDKINSGDSNSLKILEILNKQIAMAKNNLVAKDKISALADILEKGSDKYIKRYVNEKTGKKKKNIGSLLFKIHVPEHHEQAKKINKLSKEMKTLCNPPIDSAKVAQSLLDLYAIFDELSPKKGNLKRFIGYSSIDDKVKEVLIAVNPDKKDQLESPLLDRNALKKILNEMVSSKKEVQEQEFQPQGH